VPSGNTPLIDLGSPPYDTSLAERRRNQFMTMKHSIKEKMELYTSSTKGRIDELKFVLEDADKNYSVTEEISKSGYYWTVLHYASHYGHFDILEYLIEFLQDHPEKYEIFNMQTTEGKTPLFCAVLSGDIK
jgi:ankyrin repeat protein